MNTNETPEIYVACLAAYNNRYLHGAWIDATQDEPSICNDIKTLLSESPIPDAEEYAIHDHEGFCGLSIDEYEGIQSVCEKAAFIKEYGALGAKLLSYNGDCIKNAKNSLEECYYGEWDNEDDFAANFFDEHYLPDIPKHLHFYIDYHKFSYDLFINDFYSIEANSKTHVFCYF